MFFSERLLLPAASSRSSIARSSTCFCTSSNNTHSSTRGSTAPPGRTDPSMLMPSTPRLTNSAAAFSAFSGACCTSRVKYLSRSIALAAFRSAPSSRSPSPPPCARRSMWLEGVKTTIASPVRTSRCVCRSRAATAVTAEDTRTCGPTCQSSSSSPPSGAVSPPRALTVNTRSPSVACTLHASGPSTVTVHGSILSEAPRLPSASTSCDGRSCGALIGSRSVGDKKYTQCAPPAAVASTCTQASPAQFPFAEHDHCRHMSTNLAGADCLAECGCRVCCGAGEDDPPEGHASKAERDRVAESSSRRNPSASQRLFSTAASRQT